MHLDAETRAGRLAGALEGLSALFSSQPSGLMVEGEKTACLLSLLAEEAQALLHGFEPSHRAGAND